jgi:alpha-mannosidase
MGYEVLHVAPEKRAFVRATSVKASGLNALKTPPFKRDRGSSRPAASPASSTRRRNFETLAPTALRQPAQAFKDTPKEYDAWNIDPGTLDVAPTPSHKAESVEVVRAVHCAPSFASRASGRAPSSCRTSCSIPDADQVDVVNDIDWHETHILSESCVRLAASSPRPPTRFPTAPSSAPQPATTAGTSAQFEVPAIALGRSRRRQARLQSHQRVQVRL